VSGRYYGWDTEAGSDFIFAKRWNETRVGSLELE